MKNYKSVIIGLFLLLTFAYPFPALAHCPLCTAGVGVAAGVALWLGVKSIIVALFIGGFAMATALWFTKIIQGKFKKDLVPMQSTLLTITLFLATVVPLSGLLSAYTSIPFYMWGHYGGIFNRTYLVNIYYVGSLLGAFIVLVSPFVSVKLAEIRGKRIPYQGVIVTISLLLLASLILQLV